MKTTPKLLLKIMLISVMNLTVIQTTLAQEERNQNQQPIAPVSAFQADSGETLIEELRSSNQSPEDVAKILQQLIQETKLKLEYLELNFATNSSGIDACRARINTLENELDRVHPERNLSRSEIRLKVSEKNSGNSIAETEPNQKIMISMDLFNSYSYEKQNEIRNNPDKYLVITDESLLPENANGKVELNSDSKQKK